MFCKDYEFRYSDKSVDGKIKVSAVIELLQDISIAHSDSVGLDEQKFKSLSTAFLLASWRIKFCADIDANKNVTVKTGLSKITRCETYRIYEIWQSGKCVVKASAVWFTVNTEKMRIIRMADEIASALQGSMEEDNNLPCLKLKPSENSEYCDCTTVRKSDLDTNNHMNNVKSAELALGYVPAGNVFSEICIRYKKELKEFDKVEVYTSRNQLGFDTELRKNGESCVLVHTE